MATQCGVLGADGCLGGWVIARLDGRGRGALTPTVWVVRALIDVRELSEAHAQSQSQPRAHAKARAQAIVKPGVSGGAKAGAGASVRGVPALPERMTAVVAVDMPLGLLEVYQRGGRACDRAARALLNAGGARRGSSVFSPPTRGALACVEYRAACMANASGAGIGAGAGLSKQSFNLFPKLREVDEVAIVLANNAAASAQGSPAGVRMIEAHPELCFMRMAGGPVAEGKKTPAGRARRAALLTQAGVAGVDTCIEQARAAAAGLADAMASVGGGAPVRVAADDVLDALACAVVAWRVSRGAGLALPEDPLRLDVVPRDARGLAMQIWR